MGGGLLCCGGKQQTNVMPDMKPKQNEAAPCYTLSPPPPQEFQDRAW